MDCQQFKKQVGDYPDREIAAESRSALEGHAAACPPCAALLAVFRTMSDGFSTLTPIVASRDFDARLQSRLALEREGRGARRFGLPQWAPSFGLAFAAALVVVVIGLLLSGRGPAMRGIETIATRSQAPATPSTGVPREAGVSREAGVPVRAEVEPVADSPLRLVTESTPAARGPASRWDDAELARLLGDGGVPLVPPGVERRFMIDSPSDVPAIQSDGPEGEAVSSPIAF